MFQRIFGFILSLLLLISCSHLQRQPAQMPVGRNIIIFIHGIGGDENTFGAMDEYFAQRNFETHKFFYDTFNAETTVQDFSTALAKFLDQQFQERPLTENDQLHFVMHSQGGMVGMFWLLRSMNHEVGFSPIYVSQLRNFITLSAPFWGAKMAKFGENLTRIYEISGQKMIGKAQLEQMSFGSSNSYWLREQFMNEKISQQFKELTERTHFYNFAGWAHDMKLLGLVTDGKGYESDTTVPMAAARQGFYYLQDLQTNYPDQFISSEELNKKSIDPYYDLINAWHVPLIKGKGIANMPIECLTTTCQHPATMAIEKILSHQELNKNESLFKDATAFLLDLRVHFPKGTEANPESVKVHFSVPSWKMRAMWEKQVITLADPFEFMNSMYRTTEEKNQVRVFLSGMASGFYIPPQKRNSQQIYQENIVELEISAKGYKSRKVQVKIMPTYTSFVEINLEPRP